MIQKVAEAHALRRAFNIAGLYTAEEYLGVSEESITQKKTITTQAEVVEEGEAVPLITESQRKLLWKLLRDYAALIGSDAKAIEEKIKQKEGIEHLRDMPKDRASKWIDWLQRKIEEHRIKAEEEKKEETEKDEEVIVIEDNN